MGGLMMKTVKTLTLVVVGIVAVGLFYLGVSVILPPVLPTSAASGESSAAISSHVGKKPQQRTAVRHATQKKVSPNTLVKMQYNPLARSHALALAKTLHMTLLLPTHAYRHVALNESYTSGSVLNLEFNDMIAIESKHPILPSYKPAHSVQVQLPNGISAQWLTIYGVGGGGHRLQFQQDGTYVRLQLFGAYIPAGLANAERIAAQFSPVS